MKRIKIIFIICMLCMSVFMGCSKNTDDDSKEEINGSSVSEEKKDGKSEKEKASEEKKENDSLVMLLNSDNREAYNTEEGRYYISMDNNKTEDDQTFPSLMYIDYASKKEIYLCNKPNCKHKDDTCSAVLPDELMMGDYYLFGNDNNLFLVSTPSDGEGSVETCEVADGSESMLGGGYTFAPKITTINFDGTNRDDIYTFESGVVLEDVFIQQGNYLYMVTKKLSEKRIDNKTTTTTAYDRKLVRLNLDTKKLEDVMDLDNDADIVGCVGNKLVTSELVFDHELTTEEIMNDDVYFAELKKSKQLIKTLDVDTKKQEKIKEFSGKNEYSFLVSDGILYYSVQSEKNVNKIDLSNLKSQVIDKNNSYRVMYVYDNLVVCNSWNETEPDLFDGYIINTSDCTTSKMLYMKSKKIPINIVSATKDSFFVNYDFKEEDEYVEWVGVNQTVITGNSYGIISKEDLLAGKANYSEVSMIGMGY